jgi:hypothetical protein
MRCRDAVMQSEAMQSRCRGAGARKVQSRGGRWWWCRGGGADVGVADDVVGAEVQRCRGAKVQRCRGCCAEGCRCAEVDVQRRY